MLLLTSAFRSEWNDLMKFNTLETERMTLRLITPDVMSEIYTLTDAEICRYLGLSSKHELELERQRFEAGMTTFNKSFLFFQLIDRQRDVIMGWCGYHTWYTTHNRAELGYSLSSDFFKRNGFMSEAIPPILAYGFDEMQLHRIEALVAPNNIASVKLLESNGFQYEGCMKEHYLKNDVYEDSMVYGLLRNGQ